MYKTNLALYENNVSRIEQLANKLARKLKENLPTGWMPYAIEAIIAKEQGDMEEFQNEAKNSIEHARGIQKFSLVYSFEHMERKIK